MEALCSVCHARMGQTTDELRAALIQRELQKAGRTEYQQASSELLLSTQAPEPIRKAQQEVAALLILFRLLGYRATLTTEDPPF